MAGEYYESERAAAEYLLLHYADGAELGAPDWAGPAALNFPKRVVDAGLAGHRLPDRPRALELGCAVGRGTFELARHCPEVIGLDYSARFIELAELLRRNGSLLFGRIEEGDLTRACQARVPADIDRRRVRFERGDAMNIPAHFGVFDVALLANLIDRLADPRRCLAQMPRLLKPGALMILTSPYTWMTEYTPRENWIGGTVSPAGPLSTLEALRHLLADHFELLRRADLPFLIREHARKFQLVNAELSVWRRNSRPADVG